MSCRFDLYRVGVSNSEYFVEKLVSNVDFLAAVILAGVEERDFTESMTNVGWVGTCPHWTHNLPVVTIPSGDRLGLNQLDFMLEIGE